MKPTVLIISCEHAVNTVPADFNYLFAGQDALLQSAQAFDPGAQELAHYLKEKLACDYTENTVTRLLIDCNCSVANERCFSALTHSLKKDEKQYLIDRYYLPFRQQTQDLIQKHIDLNKQVLHLSIHTFTPTTNGQVYNTSIGILYDSSRHGEKEVSRQWHSLLLQQSPPYRIRLNYPFRNSDMFINQLRKKHSQKDYLGLTLECNQALLGDSESLMEMANALAKSLEELLQLL
jgi:predicted N-formylglutamate amidohydrolase